MKPVDELTRLLCRARTPDYWRVKNFRRKFLKIQKLHDVIFVSHDYMFGYVMRNEEICKGLLERLLQIKIERLEYPELQKSITPHYENKGVRLDVYVQDSTRVFDVEVQNILDDELPTRTRYYQSMMDIDLLLKGKKYSELKECYVIFVCKDDFFGENLPCYSFSNLCHEKTNLELGDKTHKIIFNASSFAKEKDLERVFSNNRSGKDARFMQSLEFSKKILKENKILG